MNFSLTEIELSVPSLTMIQILSEVKFVGFYFAAHWSPPARLFKKMLISAYNSINSPKKILEIVFVSFDRDDESFEAYSDDMPWIKVPFKNSQQRISIAHHFQIENPFKLIVLTQNLKILSKTGIEELKEKGTQCIDWWEIISENVKNFTSSPFCEKGHSMTYIDALEKIRCAFCRGEIIKGWNCAECALSVCQICEEWFSNSVPAPSILCLRSHPMRRSQKLNEYYLKKFLNDKYTCRTCNLFPTGTSLHCFSCLFDMCEKCEKVVESQPSGKCSEGHSLSWVHDLCMKIEEKYKRCQFRCEKCKESYLGGGAFACLNCEFYVCLGCIN